MTQEQKANIEKIFTNVANKQLDFDTVVGNVVKALCTDALTSVWTKSILGEDAKTPERKHFREVVALMMPHYVLNGTDKVIACDFIAATEENKLSKTIRQYRLSVDDEITKCEVCKNYIETTREEPKIKEFTLKYDSGFEEVIKRQVRNAEGEVETEKVTVQLVPRKKSVWGYTKDVKVAIINAIEYIENEK